MLLLLFLKNRYKQMKQKKVICDVYKDFSVDGPPCKLLTDDVKLIQV